MTDLWIARDGPHSDGRPGDVMIFQGRPEWCDDIDGWQGYGTRCLTETKKQQFPISERQAARLVIDTASVVNAMSVSAAASSANRT